MYFKILKYISWYLSRSFEWYIIVRFYLYFEKKPGRGNSPPFEHSNPVMILVIVPSISMTFLLYFTQMSNKGKISEKALNKLHIFFAVFRYSCRRHVYVINRKFLMGEKIYRNNEKSNRTRRKKSGPNLYRIERKNWSEPKQADTARAEQFLSFSVHSMITKRRVTRTRTWSKWVTPIIHTAHPDRVCDRPPLYRERVIHRGLIVVSPSRDRWNIAAKTQPEKVTGKRR